MIFDKTFFKFILAGIVNTLIGSALMFSLFNLAGFSYWISSGINYTLTSIISFFLNKHWTFRAKGMSVFMILAFATTIAGSYLLAYGMAKPLIHKALAEHEQNIRDNVSLFTGMCFFTVINYAGQRFFVFRS